MAKTTKNREANELRAQADALRAKMSDASIQMTADEVQQAVEGIKTLDLRAQAVAGFTPEQEIEDQGGDAELRVAAPESEEPDTKAYISAYQRWSKDAIRTFGGTDQYTRAVVNARHYDRLGKEQRNVIDRGKTLAVQAFGVEDLQTRGTIVGTAGDASGGEFLLPLQQDQSIFQVSNDQIGLLQRATRYPVAGRSIRIPYVVQTDGSNHRPMAGSIAAISIVGEGGAKPEREPLFLQRILNVYKWAAYSKIGDEVLADDMTGDLSPTVTRLVGGQVMNEMNDRMTYSGDGTNMPLGALNDNNGSLMAVNRATSGSVSSDDVFAMWARHTHGPQSFWLASRRVIEALFTMTLGNNTLVTWIGGLQSAPTMMLLGYPVVVSDLVPTLGKKADLSLVNPAFYAVAVRQQLTVESSIHFDFINDVTTYRFFARGGGVPIPDGTYAYRAVGGVKIDEHSPFVVLDDSVTS